MSGKNSSLGVKKHLDLHIVGPAIGEFLESFALLETHSRAGSSSL